MLGRGQDPMRLAAWGVLAGVAAFSTVIFAAPVQSAAIFFAGAALIGFGGGLFSVSTLIAAMSLPSQSAGNGLALGAWGAAQATAAGLAVAIGGGLRDAVNTIAIAGGWGEALATPATGYSFVYHFEIGLLFLTLVLLGPLARRRNPGVPTRMGLADFPT